MCSPCSEGTATEIIGATECEPCPEGYFAAGEGHSICQPCPIGAIANSTGTPSCRPCPLQYTTNTVGSTECVYACGNGRLDTGELWYCFEFQYCLHFLLLFMISNTDIQLSDDGNTNDGDGCVGDCLAIESGYACLKAGQPCQKQGNKIIIQEMDVINHQHFSSHVF